MSLEDPKRHDIVLTVEPDLNEFMLTMLSVPESTYMPKTQFITFVEVKKKFILTLSYLSILNMFCLVWTAVVLII